MLFASEHLDTSFERKIKFRRNCVEIDNGKLHTTEVEYWKVETRKMWKLGKVGNWKQMEIRKGWKLEKVETMEKVETGKGKDSKR